MIDEKRLISNLSDWMFQESFLRQLKNPSDIISECIKVVEEQPKIGEWIPCSEGEPLPKEGQKVLLQDYYGDMEIGRFGRDGLYRDGFYINGRFLTANNYLAWQPLPKEYHEQAD